MVELSHAPQTINKFQSGLVQYQPDQILSNDSFPILLNSWCFRNTMQRRLGRQLLGRLKRNLEAESLGTTGASPWSFTIYSQLSPAITGEPNAQIVPGSVQITIATPIVFNDDGLGALTSVTIGNSGTINYATGEVTITHTAGSGIAVEIDFSYYPALPAMGIFDRTSSGNTISTTYMDTKYTYRYLSASGFEEFPTGSIWNLLDNTLPSSLNYWVDSSNNPIFWITNIRGTLGSPIRYTNALGSSIWYDFTPGLDGTTVAPTPPNATIFLFQSKFLLPFRGRLFAFNTLEGATIGSAVNFSNRIRCSAVTTPFDTASAIITQINQTAWSDVIPGQGFAQDLPGNEPIVGAWLVMNQIVIMTRTKTYLLTHTGISTSPFKIDLVDDNIGSTSGFSAANMGGYLVNIGNRSINETSPVSVRDIDIKILDFVFSINRENSGFDRIYAIRNFIQRANSFIYPYQPDGESEVKFPNRRLIYNYDNKSWAIYEDSLTCLGYFRDTLSRTWQDSNFSWAEANFAWNQDSVDEPVVAAGNQQGFIQLLDNSITEGSSLSITAITKVSGDQACIFSSPDSNLENGTIIRISGIISTLQYLNEKIGKVQTIDENTFYLFEYNAQTDLFDIPVIIPDDDMDVYLGGGEIQVRYNFRMLTKAINALEEGQSVHISYVDTLVNTAPGSLVRLSVYVSLNQSNPVNSKPESDPEDFLQGNSLSQANPTTYDIEKVNNRAIVNQRSNMISLGFTVPNSIMASNNFLTPFILSSLTLWIRKAGRPLMPFGGG